MRLAHRSVRRMDAIVVPNTEDEVRYEECIIGRPDADINYNNKCKPLFLLALQFLG